MSTEVTNLNYLTSTRATMVLPGLSTTEFTATDWSIPGINLPAAHQPTPFNNKPHHGDKIEFDPLSVTFLITEDLSNWVELYNWVVARGAPDDKAVQYKGNGFFDAFVTVYSSHNNPIGRFKFIDCVIVALSSIELSTQDADTVYKSATVMIEYERFDYEKAS